MHTTPGGPDRKKRRGKKGGGVTDKGDWGM